MKEQLTEKFSIVMDAELADWVRDYRYTKICQTGDINFTIRQVIEDAVKLLKKTTDLKVTPRPQIVRDNEHKMRVRKAREQKNRLKR